MKQFVIALFLFTLIFLKNGPRKNCKTSQAYGTTEQQRRLHYRGTYGQIEDIAEEHLQISGII